MWYFEVTVPLTRPAFRPLLEAFKLSGDEVGVPGGGGVVTFM